MHKKVLTAIFLAIIIVISGCGKAETDTVEVPEEEISIGEMPPRPEPENVPETVTEEPEETEEIEEVSEPEEEEPEDVTFGTYEWGILGYEVGDSVMEDNMVMEITTIGKPGIADSTIEFTVTEEMFNYRLFTEIDAGNDLVIDKDNTWIDNVEDDGGIFGYVDDSFTLNLDGEDTDENGDFITVFSFEGTNGHNEFTVIWKANGSLEVDRGTLTEI